jgi:hypothetical protein
MMNLPKRRPGRRRPVQCTGGTDTHATRGDDQATDQLAYLNWVAATVGEYGWAISGSHGDGQAPPWAYSVGVWLTCQGPELVLCGLPLESAAGVINAISTRIADGADISAGAVLEDVCPAPLAIRPVEASWRSGGLLATSDTFYGMVRPPYLQVVWSDTDGRFPWDAGFHPGYRGWQPLLWLPRDDNPPSPWTRLRQAG